MAGGPGWRSPFFLGIGGGSQPTPPPGLSWTLGTLWQQAVTCAHNGSFGIRRTANGVLASSDVTSTKPFSVTGGASIFTSFYAKAGVGADGSIGFGFSFYDVNSVLINAQFIQTTGFPANWTQFAGNIIVPPFAVTATPTVRAFNNLNGSWCVDTVQATTSGGSFMLSGLRHWFSDYSLFR